MKKLIPYLLFYLISNVLSGQQLDWNDAMDYPPSDAIAWRTFHGDGQVETSIDKHDGFLRFHVNAMDDTYNAWWAIMQRPISLPTEIPSGTPLWMEAEVRSSHPMRRINMRLYSTNQEVSDHHSNLMEFDLADTATWYKIRFSPNQLTYQKGDQLIGHFALMDWGVNAYYLDVRNVRVFYDKDEKVNPSANALPYHPEPKKPASFSHSVAAEDAGMIDFRYPASNLAGWGTGDTPLLSVSHELSTLLKWDLSHVNDTVDGWGLLRLAVFSSQQVPMPEDEFCRLRVVEIIGGNTDWDSTTLTYESLAQGQEKTQVFNEQMVIDMFVPKGNDQVLDIPLPPNVLQRLITGRTKGLVFFPLGSLQVSFYASENGDSVTAPSLYFNLKNESK
ncbi:hypothetical protein [Cyclobacterium jeungdonense]|uniref:Uncharacterized protein n=1 Tax=Cyclobacterium jeungdonense TaxID=708087 RepID=A0ABT8C9G3_9BACT|nr:hypothetical protein [Cyclobacterium jeungdonense]MDN3689439.1 hypothetical protein [Cyclobacterium jeungdonense]